MQGMPSTYVGNSHPLIKNQIINHIFRTLENEPNYLQVTFVVTSQQASIEKDPKGLQG